MLPLLIVGIALVAVAAVALYSALSGARSDAEKGFDPCHPAGGAVNECPFAEAKK